MQKIAKNSSLKNDDATDKSIPIDNLSDCLKQTNLLNIVLQNINMAVLLESKNGTVEFVNSMFCDLFCLPINHRDLIGSARKQVFERAAALSQIAPLIETNTESSLLPLIDGRLLSIEVVSFSDPTSQMEGLLWTFRDVSTKFASHILAPYSNNDQPPSRVMSRLFFEKLIEAALNQPDEHALLYLDVDKFKRINYTAGHIIGDKILSDIKNIIGNTLDDAHVAAHITSDEFAVLVKGDMNVAKHVAESLRDAIANYHYQLDSIPCYCSISIGVVSHIAAQPDTSKLLAQADVVCDEAKKLGSGQIRLHLLEDTLLTQKQQEQLIISSIRDAIKHNRFQLFAQKLTPLQPSQADDGLHIEVLLRLQDANGLLIPPDKFIPLAESIGLMVHIDRWVIEHTIALLAENQVFLESIAICAINLSGQSLMQNDLASFILSLLKKHNVPANKICFEITETAAVSQLPQAESLMLSLKSAGCAFALDDFGAGQSSFRYLKGLPVNYLKIDGSFIQNIDQDRDDPTDEALVRGMHEIARALKIGTVAEYVERKETSELLRDIGIDYAQGWYYHKAEPITNLIKKQ